MPSAATTDAEAAALPWRLANILAIASPYIFALALFLVLYFTRPPAPQPAAVITPPPAASLDGPSVEAAPAGADEAPPPDHPVAHPAPASPPSLHAPAGQPRQGSSPADLSHPVAVDSVTAGTMKLSGDPPSYPAIAAAAHIEGTVVVGLTVAGDGSVRAARAVSGPALLQPAAVAAVRTWRYRPWLVQGQAVPFETNIAINFRLQTASPPS